MGRSTLLISDLDGTLLGDGAALSEFARWAREQSGRLDLAFASGRFCDSIAESIAHTPLPEPVALIGGVGTEIERWPSRQRLSRWEQQITAGYTAERVREVLSVFPQLQPQPEALQSPRKVSYFCHQADPGLLDEIADRLAQASILADTIYSSQRDLDVLPRGVNKGTAAAFLAHALGFDPPQVLVAGDSGNDLAMFQQRFLGIVPHNAHAELRELNHPRVYHSPCAYAGGVLDGVQYWMSLSDHEHH